MTYRRLVTILLCGVVITNVGCTSMKTVKPVTHPGAPAPFGNIKAGDTVQVRTTDGRVTRFVVQQVEGDAILAADGVRYTSAEVVELKKKSFSGAKTTGLIAGICGTVFVIAAIAVASALDGIWAS